MTPCHICTCTCIIRQDVHGFPQVLRGNRIFTAPEGNARSSATDGDMDAAYALLLAGQKWKDPPYTERGKKVRNTSIFASQFSSKTGKTNDANYVMQDLLICICKAAAMQLHGALSVALPGTACTCLYQSTTLFSGKQCHLYDVIQVCAAIWEWSVTHETFITNLGDWCKTDESKASDHLYWVSRTSDYMLCHFQIFSEVRQTLMMMSSSFAAYGAHVFNKVCPILNSACILLHTLHILRV